MIRELAIGSILLIAQAVPAFAEIVPIACTDDSKGTTQITYRIFRTFRIDGFF